MEQKRLEEEQLKEKQFRDAERAKEEAQREFERAAKQQFDEEKKKKAEAAKLLPKKVLSPKGSQLSKMKAIMNMKKKKQKEDAQYTDEELPDFEVIVE